MSQLYEYVKMAFSNIKANKVRSFLTMLGIIIGISSVILVLSLGNGAKNVITESLAGLGSGQIVMYTTDETKTYNMTDEDIAAVKQQIPGVKAVTAQYYQNGNVVTKKGNFKVSGYGVMPENEYFSTAGFSKGRYFNETEYEAGRPVCVIGEKDAMRIFGSSDVIGMDMDVTMNGMDITFTIVGVQKPSSTALMSFAYENSPIEIYFPITLLQQVCDLELGSYDQIYVLAKEDANTYDIVTQLTNLMERRHQCQGEEESIYQVENFSDYMTIVNTVINMVTAIISLVAAISLVVGGIGVMNIMLVSVTERTREIGIRKSLGAKTKSIMLQFLSESAIITMIGGAIGILLGIGSAYLVADVVALINPSLAFTPSISAGAILIATGFSCGIGIFFGIYPAKKAAKLSPIEALRRM